MTAIASASILDDLTLAVTQEIRVKAPIDSTFRALIEQLGHTTKCRMARRCP